MVALVLLTLCLPFLLRSPFIHLQQQENELLQLHLHREGEELLQYAEEMLRTHALTWEMVIDSEKTPFYLPVPETRSYIVKPQLRLSTLEVVQDTQKNFFGKIRVTVAFIPSKKKRSIHTASRIFCLSYPPLP
ncbi:MAG: hypothetical protein FJZ58_03875 [Chlamydiae bacterium]|nr:hypothetical protein [Chlamydiota bacterium]